MYILADKGKKRFFDKKNFFFMLSQNIVIFAEMSIVWQIKAKNDFWVIIFFFQVISTYRYFCRNVYTLADKRKKQFFGKKLIFLR